MDDQATRLRRLVEDKTANYGKASDQRNTAAELEAKGPRTIAITSGKGGVGKTNLTVNLAIALGKKGQRVIVIDADMGTANVDVLLGTSSKQNLMSLLEDGVELEDVLLRGPYGVSYISGGSGMEHAWELSTIQRQVIFNKLAGCEAWADIILVDTGAGVGKNVLDFIMASDEVLLLTTPEPTSLTDGYAVLKAYRQVSEQPSVKLIVNRVFDVMESTEAANKLIRTADKFLDMKLECMGYIFDDSHLVRAVRQQVPVIESYPNSLAAQCLEALANNILSGKQDTIKLGWRGFLRKIFRN